MLANQLSVNLLDLEGYGNESEKEPFFSQKNGSREKMKSNNILTNEGNLVNEKISESVGETEMPIPLESSVVSPPFPVHCLPKTLREYVLAVTEDKQTPIDMSAVASIGTSSA